jgi:predicted RNA-binding protein with PIN domain
MEKARAGLVETLVGYRKKSDHDIVLVFDGYRNGKAVQQVLFSGHVKVIYTRLGERADDVIKKIVSDDRREWIVVTADRDIADHAWAVGSVPVPSESFISTITRNRQEKSDAISSAADDYEYEERHQRKGNPHQLSKKEKAIRRVLNKL